VNYVCITSTDTDTDTGTDATLHQEVRGHDPQPPPRLDVQDVLRVQSHNIAQLVNLVWGGGRTCSNRVRQTINVKRE